ncbi:MAG: hypothetical protein QM778_00815 [Myxococcales bacterium]
MRKLLAVLNVALVVGYPLAVYFGLTRFGARGVSLLLLALLLPGLLQKFARASREDLRTVLGLPLSVFCLVGASALLDDPRLVLALPVLINVALLIQFGLSLRGTPMVERFARMQDPNLGPAQVVYCRTVTLVWCGFFVLNALVSGYLALFAELASWALYTGLIAYVLMGVLGACEYLVRKARFREYGPGLHDRVIARIFPPPGAGEVTR